MPRESQLPVFVTRFQMRQIPMENRANRYNFRYTFVVDINLWGNEDFDSRLLIYVRISDGMHSMTSLCEDGLRGLVKIVAAILLAYR